MSRRQLYLGLWGRMVGALVVSAAGLLVILAVEFALATGLTIFVLFSLSVLGIIFLTWAGVVGVLIGLVWLVALWRGQAEPSDLRGKETVRTTLGRAIAERQAPLGPPSDPPTVTDAATTVGSLAGLGVVLILAHQLVFTTLNLDSFWLLCLGIVGGTVATIGFTGWVIVNEVRSTKSVQAELEAVHDVISAPEYQQTVQRRVRRLAQQADSPVPAVKISASSLPRAATVGYHPSESVILVSRGLIKTLNDEELDAVLAHELAHLINRDAAVMTVLSMPRAKIRRLVRYYITSSPRAGLSVVPVLIVSIPVYIANRLTVPTVARYREYVADDSAVAVTGDPAAMASALLTLDREHSSQPSRDLRRTWSTAAFNIVPPAWEERTFFDKPIRFVYRRLLGSHPLTETRIKRLRA